MLIDQVSRSSCGRNIASLPWQLTPGILLLEHLSSDSLLSTRPKGQAHGWHSLGQKHSVSKGHRGRQATEGSGQLTGAEPLARDEEEPLVSLQSPMFKQLCETLCCFPVQSCCTNWPLTKAVTILWFPKEDSFVAMWWNWMQGIPATEEARPGTDSVRRLDSCISDHCMQQQAANTSQVPTSTIKISLYVCSKSVDGAKKSACRKYNSTGKTILRQSKIYSLP